MNVLLLTQIVPYPPDSGPKVKTYHVLRYLAERGHQVTLASFVRDHEKPYLSHLQNYCKEIHPVSFYRSRIADLKAYVNSLSSGLPFLVTRDAQSEMIRLIDELASEPQFDIVHADQLTMAQYALQFRRSSAGSKSPAIVFDAHNAVYEIVERTRQTAVPFLRPILAIEAGRLRQYEGSLIAKFDHTLAVSEIDKHALLRVACESSRIGSHTSGDWKKEDLQQEGVIALGSKVSVIPIAVDSASLQPVKQAERFDNILTMGTLFYPPNADGIRWFMREVFPLVRRQVPAATLTVVGPRPPKDIIEFGRRNAECVRVTGYVPDLQTYFEHAALMVVPVRVGSGMRVRILETLARGIPLVTTTTGVEGIDAVNGEHLLVADEPSEFAEAVVRLLQDRALGESLVQSGRRLVEKKYDWRVVLPKLETIYESLNVE